MSDEAVSAVLERLYLEPKFREKWFAPGADKDTLCVGGVADWSWVWGIRLRSPSGASAVVSSFDLRRYLDASVGDGSSGYRKTGFQGTVRRSFSSGPGLLVLWALDGSSRTIG